jgi:virulence factor
MIKLGIVDFDTSHCVAFTQRLNHIEVGADQWVNGAQIVMGCPGTSLVSPERVPGYTEQLKAYGVNIVDDPAEMIGKVDGVLIESVDGSVHYERAEPFLKAGVPMFIDKPFTCSLEQAVAIAKMAEKKSVTVFSSSSLRYGLEVQQIHEKQAEIGKVVGADAYSPGPVHPRNPSLFHYGIHGLETLYALMGSGCSEVWAVSTEGVDVVTGAWSGGRVGTVRCTRAGAHSYGFTAFCEKRVVSASINAGFIYLELLKQIVKMFETGKSPVDIRETLEIIAFIEAVMVSSRQNGTRVPLGKF